MLPDMAGTGYWPVPLVGDARPLRGGQGPLDTSGVATGRVLACPPTEIPTSESAPAARPQLHLCSRSRCCRRLARPLEKKQTLRRGDRVMPGGRESRPRAGLQELGAQEVSLAVWVSRAEQQAVPSLQQLALALSAGEWER